MHPRQTADIQSRRLGWRIVRTRGAQLPFLPLLPLTIADLLIINGSLLVALTTASYPLTTPPLPTLHPDWFVTLSLLWILFAVVLDLYTFASITDRRDLLQRALLAASLTPLIYFALPRISPPLATRTYALTLLVLPTLAIPAWRLFYASLAERLLPIRRAALLLPADPDPLTLRLARDLTYTSPLPGFVMARYTVVGTLVDHPSSASPTYLPGLPRLGTLNHLAAIAKEHGLHRLIVADPPYDQSSPTLAQAVLNCQRIGLEIDTLLDAYERAMKRIPLDRPVIPPECFLRRSPPYQLYAALARLRDICCSSIALLALAAVTPAIALLNALFSPGPLLHRHLRVGKGGRLFTAIKFRTTSPDPEPNTGADHPWHPDAHVTPVGDILRRAHLDGLPQVINVMWREMSFIGPHPESPHLVDEVTRALPLYAARHILKPGLTGWAQTHHPWGTSLDDVRINLEYDLYYLKHAGPTLDLLTVVDTVRSVLGPREFDADQHTSTSDLEAVPSPSHDQHAFSLSSTPTALPLPARERTDLISAEDAGTLIVCTQTPLTSDHLQSRIAPYIEALVRLQHLIDELHGTSPREITIRSITQLSPISIGLDGAAEAIQVVRDHVVPWRRQHAQTMARLSELEKQAQIESTKAEILEKRARAAKDRAHTKQIDSQARLQREKARRLQLENEKLAQDIYQAKVDLALRIIDQLSPGLADAKRIGLLIKMLPPLGVLLTSELEIEVGPTVADDPVSSQ